MPMREFDDAKGVHWKVWSTVPSPESPLARYYPGGWLTFDGGGETIRRLSPAPKGWETVPPERPDLMCRAAQEVPRHTGEMLRMTRPADIAPPAPELPEEPASPPEEDERPKA